MLSISHGLTGAWVANAFPNPLFYIPVNLLFHYLEDWTPHWDIGTGMKGGRKKRLVITLGLVDLAIAFFISYWLFQKPETELQIHVWLGFIAGLLPDFVEAPKNFLKWEPPWTKPLNNFHQKVHFSTSNTFLGLATQLPIWIFVWFSPKINP
ncbi:MAG: hypothetical protein ACOZAN_03825 [Patescibacteria group bacterium]